MLSILRSDCLYLFVVFCSSFLSGIGVENSAKMGLIAGIFMGVIFGIALMAGWQHMTRHRSTKRVAKVSCSFCVF